MLHMTMKQALAVFLAVLMVRPFPVQAAPAAAVLGSISSYGAVTVGDLPAPGENTLFAGDLVNTQVGSAVVQYSEGTRVLLAMNSSAQFAAGDVQLQAGEMSFRTASAPGFIFHASSLLLEPTASTSANVILSDRKATVSVTEGAVRVVDPTGVPLTSIQAGEARLFAMASPAAAPPAAPGAAALQAGSGTLWLLALALATAGTSFGVAGLIRANNASDDAEATAAKNAELQSQLAAIQSTATALQATITSLQGQITSMQATIASLQASGTAQAGQIAALQATVTSLQGQVTSSQATINTLQATITALQNSGTAQTAQITALQSTVAALQGQITNLQTQIVNLLAQIADLQAQIDSISPSSP